MQRAPPTHFPRVGLSWLLLLILSTSLCCHCLASGELCTLEGSNLLLGKSKSGSELVTGLCHLEYKEERKSERKEGGGGGGGGQVWGKREEGRRAEVLDLTGSHVLFYLTSTIHLQSLHLVIQGRCQGLWCVEQEMGRQRRQKET